MSKNLKCCASLLTLAAVLYGTQAYAQVAAPSADAAASPDGTVGEVVVTARKRNESLIEVPVAITALDAKQIERQGIHSFDDIVSVVPGLSIGQVSGGVGATIVLRGVGTTAGSNPSFEQTVAVNIDGVQISRGTAIRLGQIDMAGIEILRGPQALFFGKNSPAGVISIRTADPTREKEVMARVGYELNAKEKIADLVISGPITDTLGARLTMSASDLEGWMKNKTGEALAAANAIRPNSVSSFTARGPQQTFLFARGTVKWDPTERLSARAKVSYASTKGVGYQQGGGFQRIYCPNGVAVQSYQSTPLNGGVANPALASALAADNCKADNLYANGNINPAFLVGSPEDVRSVEGAGDYSQSLSSLEVNYSLSDAVKLTSVTGYTRIGEWRYDTYGNSPADASSALDFSGRTNFTQFSEEARLATSFAGPINGLVGVFYEDSDLSTYTRLFAAAPTPREKFMQYISGKVVSVFGQAIWNVTPTVELAGGARWSQEKKGFDVTRNGVDQPLAVRDQTFENTSPEATLTWRPNKRLTLYSAYKQGFKSGGYAAGFNTGAAFTPPGPDVSYRPERAKGYEVGLKTKALDGALRLNAAAYDYDYSNLQVNSLDNSSGIPVIRVTNAAAATVRGIEFDGTYAPPVIRGLELSATANYNKARYTSFLASCYIGQTIADGCNQLLNPLTNQFTSQQLSGRPLINAPLWTGSLGANYERDLPSGMTIALSTDARYKSSYNPHPELAPGAAQDSAWFYNASVRLMSESRAWEVALIGRNLSEVYRVNVASNAGSTGVGARTGTALAGGLADLNGNVNRGREILLQFTLRPSRWF